MNLPELIFISGFMGSGKSTLGQNLASRLNQPFVDLDEEVEKETEKSIKEIFEDSDEAKFRSLERKALMHLSNSFSGIIALGGGSLQNQELLDHLKSKGLLIFIETPLEVVIERLSGSQNRPLLLDDDGNVKDRDVLEKELEMLYEDRLPLYKQAEITIKDDDSHSPDELGKVLYEKIKRYVENH